MTIKRLLTVTIMTTALLLTGCGSSSSDDGEEELVETADDAPDETAEVAPVETAEVAPLETTEVAPDETTEVAPIETEDSPLNGSTKRIKTISFDLGQDGVTDLVLTYDYDDLGRVISQTMDDKVDSEESSVVYYEYNGEQLVRKYSEDGAQDVHTYQNGLLVASNRNRDGEHTYTYDTSNRLISSTGDNSLFDDDCDGVSLPVGVPSEQSEPPEPPVIMSYAGDKPDVVATSDGLKLLQFNYNERQQLVELVESVSCSGEEDLDLAKEIYFYNDAGQLRRVDRFVEDVNFQYISDYETIGVTRDNSGKMIEVVEVVESGLQNEITTTKRTYGADDLPSSDNITITGQDSSFIFRRDQTITYTYEDAPCQIFHSSNPIILLMLDRALQVSLNPDALKCGFKLDETEI